LDGEREVEQGPESVMAHGSPAALYRARDARVATLWQSFVLVAPQAVNDEGLVRYWRWGDAKVKERVVAEVEQVLAGGKVNRERVYGAGFSRGGLGCYQLDGVGSLQCRKIVTADAQSLEGLEAAAARHREVRAYYARSTYSDILAPHVAAQKLYGSNAQRVSVIPTDVRGKDGDAHIGMCSHVFANDEVYRWLLA